jgi:hypothetical protein
VYFAFGDESRDKQKGVYAVACVFGHQNEWEDIAGPWVERLGERVFHASDCESGHGDFQDLEEGARHKLYRDLVSIVAGSKLIGHGEAINCC